MSEKWEQRFARRLKRQVIIKIITIYTISSGSSPTIFTMLYLDPDLPKWAGKMQGSIKPPNVGHMPGLPFSVTALLSNLLQ